MILMWSLIALALLLTVIACSWALGNRKRLTAIEHSLNSNIQALRRELDVVNSAAIGVGSRLISVEKKLNISIEKQQRLEQDNAGYYSYNEAASMAEHGIKASQIAEKCGLSEAEANLMALLNNKIEVDSQSDVKCSENSYHRDSVYDKNAAI